MALADCNSDVVGDPDSRLVGTCQSWDDARKPSLEAVHVAVVVG